MTDNQAIILGSGGSMGVPMILNNWGACDPDNPKNRRSRTSLAVQAPQGLIIIDTGPDFKEQMNRENLGVPAAVFYTHGHDDHVIGMNEMRGLSFAAKKPIDIYASEETFGTIKNRFGYIFHPDRPDLYRRAAQEHIWQEDDFFKSFSFLGLDIELIPLDHESVISTGFIFNRKLAYTTDLVRIEKRSLESLKGIETWIIDCGAYKNPNNLAHAHMDQIMSWNRQVGAKKVYFTAMPPSMDYDVVSNETPPEFEPAYDGLKILF